MTQNVQQFAPDTPMLPVPPPDMIPPEQYIPQADVTNNKKYLHRSMYQQYQALYHQDQLQKLTLTKMKT